MKIFVYTCLILGKSLPATSFLPARKQRKLLVGPSFDSNTPIFTVSHPKINKFTIIRDICKFLQLGLIFSMRFEEKLGHTNLKPKRIYLYIMDLIFNDWKHIL